MVNGSVLAEGMLHDQSRSCQQTIKYSFVYLHYPILPPESSNLDKDDTGKVGT